MHRNALLGCLALTGMLLSGCGWTERGIAGVKGLLTVDGKPAPAGTAVCFSHAEDSTNSFTTAVDSAGYYSYQPPEAISVRQGLYRIAVWPIRAKTMLSPGGTPYDVPIPGAPKSYGKFSDVETSELKVELSTKPAQFDIVIETH